MSLTPVERANALGHNVESDPPFASAAERWTCVNCPNAVIRYGTNVYGSAVEQPCPNPENHKA